MEDDERFYHVVNCVNQASLKVVEDYLTENDFAVIWFDGRNVFDELSFYGQAAIDIPQPAGMITYDNYAAFRDNITNEIPEVVTKKRVAIVWTDAQNILIRGLQDFLLIYSIFEDSATFFLDRRWNPEPIIFRIFLIGKGDNFPVVPPKSS